MKFEVTFDELIYLASSISIENEFGKKTKVTDKKIKKLLKEYRERNKGA